MSIPNSKIGIALSTHLGWIVSTNPHLHWKTGGKNEISSLRRPTCVEIWYAGALWNLHCIQANSAFHPSGVGKWVPAAAGKEKAGMVSYSVSGWTRGVQAKLWDHIVPYPSALEVCSRRGTIQIHVHLYLTAESASWLKLRTTGGTGCLKWQCIANCHWRPIHLICFYLHI